MRPCALLLLLTSSLLGQTAVWTANYDNQRSNSNRTETTLTTQNVNSATFGRIGTLTVDGQIYGQPLYLPKVNLPGMGPRNLVFTATMRNTVYAFDADARSTGPVWQVNLGSPVPASVLNFKDIQPAVGVLSTPVIDASRGVIYIVAATYESNTCIYRLHALSVTDGQEVQQGPVSIQASVTGDGWGGSDAGVIAFDAAMHLQRPGLLLANGNVYIAFGSHADKAPYHGWLIAYDASNLQQQVAVWNSSTKGGGAAIWQAGRAPAADDAGNVYICTGNGDYDGESNFGESFVKLSPQLRVLDWFTPTNWQELSDGDYDMGSTGAVLIPQSGLVLGGDKYGTIYSLDSSSLGQLSAGAQSFGAVRWGGIFNLAVWPASDSTRLYLLEQGNGVRGFQLSGTQFNTTPFAQSTATFDIPYDGIAVSGNGGKASNTSAAIVWMTSGNHNVSPSPGTLHAFHSQTLTELWNSDIVANDRLGLFAKFVAPTVADGKVFVPTFSNQLVVYGLLPTAPPGQTPHVTAVTSGAAFAGGQVSPGEVVAVFGTGLGPNNSMDVESLSDGLAGTQLAGYLVSFGGIPAPLLYLSNNQLGVIVPWSVSGTSTTVQVSANGITSPPATIAVAPSSPGIFTADGSGLGQAAALNQDGSPNSPENPAAPGSAIVLYLTGGGLMTPATSDGEVISLTAPPPQLQLPLSATIGNSAAQVLYAGAAPGQVAGVVQVNLSIPPNTPSGSQIPVVVTIGGRSSAGGTYVAVR